MYINMYYIISLIIQQKITKVLCTAEKWLPGSMGYAAILIQLLPTLPPSSTPQCQSFPPQK